MFQRAIRCSIAERTTAHRWTGSGRLMPARSPGHITTAQTPSGCASSCAKIGASAQRDIRIDRVVILRGYASEADRLAHEGCHAFCLHLFHDFSAIAFNRPYADIKLGGNRMTRESLHHEIEDFDLPGRQAREPVAERALRFAKVLLFEPSRQGPVDRGNELR